MAQDQQMPTTMSREPGAERRPTLRTVATAAGVSPALVSFALNGRPGVSEAKREEIIRLARDLGYQADPLARELRTGKTAMFGLIIRNVANPFFSDVLASMQEAAFADRVTIIAMDSRYSEERERIHIERLASRRVSSLAIAPVGAADAVLQWSALRPGARTVLVNSSVRPGGTVPHVAPDADSAVSQAFLHLWNLGHRRIAFLSAPPGVMSDEDRFETYSRLCQSHSVPLLPIFTALQAAAIVDTVERALVAPQPPSAIVTNSDFSALYVYIAAARMGLRIGRDISVVGHDDLDTSALLSPPLTTLRLDRRKLGQEIYARLDGSATGDHRAPVELIIRGSTGAPWPDAN
jgi:DNA-binding LacI/PurR family transcriptional regulator